MHFKNSHTHSMSLPESTMSLKQKSFPGFEKGLDQEILQEVFHELNSPSKDHPELDVTKEELLDSLYEMIVGKGEDYSGPQKHTWMSFVIEAMMSNVSVDTIFLTSFARKFARLISLLGEDREENFESVEDSWMDLLGYLILFIAWKRFQRHENDSNPS